MVNPQNLKLKTLLLGSMVLALLLIISIISYINITGFSSTFNTLTEKELLPSIVDKGKLQIEYQLSEPIILSRSIAENTFIKQWAEGDEPSEVTASVVNYLQSFVSNNGAAMSFFVSDLSNNYYTNKGFFKQMSRSEPRDSWFYNSLASGKNVALNMQVDETTQNLTVYVNVLVKGEDGKTMGVAGLGYDVSAIINIVESAKVGEAGFMFLLNADNQVVAHPDNSLIGKPIDQLGFDSSLVTGMKNSAEEVSIGKGKLGRQQMYVASTMLGSIGWRLVTVLPQAELTDQVNSVVSNSIFSGIVLAVIFILVFYYIARSVSKSITGVGDKLNSMAASGGDLTLKLDDSARNELGYLASGFNAILSKFAELVREITQAEQAISTGVGQLKNIAEESVQLSDSQRQQTEMVATAITEIGQTISEVSSIAQTTASDTSSAVKDTHSTNDVIVQLSATMTDLAESMTDSEKSISELANQADSINSVVDVISGISEQTNLLALNAAIEAARAGEQGRGFAVVADEVRTLASRTQDSTEKIRTQIEQLQTAAAASLAVTEEGAKSSSALAEQAVEASSSLTSIRNRFDMISEGNIQVAAATEEQAAVVNSINESAQSISDMASTIHNSSQSQISEVETLNQRAEHMRRIISQFKV